MRGSDIVLASAPRGAYLEGYASEILSPGQIVQIQRGVALRDGSNGAGRMTWEKCDSSGGVGSGTGSGTDGYGLLAVVDINYGLGKIATDAYAAGDRVFLYVPDTLKPKDGDGTLQEASSSDSYIPFQSLEADGSISVDTLIACVATGK